LQNPVSSTIFYAARRAGASQLVPDARSNTRALHSPRGLGRLPEVTQRKAHSRRRLFAWSRTTAYSYVSDRGPNVTEYEPLLTLNSGAMLRRQSFSRKFTKAGTYQYYCIFQDDTENMMDTIVVQ
jgi:hypothetical protein